MKNKKILIIIPIILIVLLLIGIGVGAFVYIKTDIFKSPKQLFFKYVVKTFETSEDFDYDEFLEEYKAQSQKSYKTSGEITISINSNASDVKELKEALDKSKLTYKVNSIPTQKKGSTNISAIYNNNEIVKFEGLAVNDNYGLKCTDLYDKYVYIENNNLQALAKKFGITSTSFPDKIENIDVYDLLYVSKDARTKIKDTYYDLLNEKLNKKMFSAEKNIEITVNGETIKTNAYSLTLTEEELCDVSISVLETLKNDDTTLDLIVEKADKSNIKDTLEQEINTTSSYSNYGYTTSSNKVVTFDKEYLKNRIQDLINDLSEEKSSTSADNTAKITVYVNKGNTVKLELAITDGTNDEPDTYSLDITRNKNGKNVISLVSEGETVLKAEYTESKENDLQKLKGNITIASDDTTLPIDFNIESGKELSKINIKTTIPYEDVVGTSQTNFKEDFVLEFDSQINGELGKGTNNNYSYISITSGNDTLKLNIKEDVTYTDDVSIDDLNTNNGICLNDMSKTEISLLLQEISTNLQNVLPSKLELLGIDSSTLGSNTADDTEIDSNTTINTTSSTEHTDTTDYNDSLIVF